MPGLLIKRSVQFTGEGHGIFWLNDRLCTLVDLDDYERLKHHHYRPKRKKKKIYAVRRYIRHGKTYEVMLHNDVMHPPPGIEPHHKNHDTLDNRRENLENVPHDNHPR
jgi:hypothetical protein